MKTFEEFQQENRNAQHHNEQLEIFLQWLQKNPQFQYLAAQALIKQEFHGGDWDFQQLDEVAAFLVQEGRITRLPAKTMDDFVEEDKQEREDLISWIMENRTWASQESKESEFARLSRIESNIPIVSTETLRTIKANIENKRRLDKLSLPELKAEARQDETQLLARHGIRESQWLPIPPLYQHRSMLISLANTNFDEFKLLTKKCGKHQIDAILNKPEKE